MATDVWVAKDDGNEFVRASAIAAVRRDYNGNVTVRLTGGEQAVVTLIADDSHEGPGTPEDFHVQLLRRVAELSDSYQPAIVRPVHEAPGGWKWETRPLQER